ncbi:hypothetical protein Mgra_00006479 [Meloidogyne graminicola]|uniref:Uncharacterized protein n=1 Tax=Meloidogyne graminicola TaxID=189291 RepID=A0A8S9ZLR6_9BILA|nr:hypothetical protein Mgra_00006479 [Meloidogyne graminicola]
MRAWRPFGAASLLKTVLYVRAESDLRRKGSFK